MKKIISMLLVVVMLLSIMPLTVFAADYDVTIKVDTINTDTVDYTAVQPGTVLKIPVDVVSNDGVSAFNLEAVYDPNVFELIEGTDLFTIDEDDNCDNMYIVAGATAGENIVFNAGDKVRKSTGVFANLNLKVKDNAPVGQYTIGLKVADPAEKNFLYYDSASNSQVAITPTLIAGEITVKYDTARLSFVNGSQTMTYDEAKADAEGANTLTKPGDDYHFVGWFSGLADSYKDANGYYVIEPTATVTGIAGTELRPRYQTPPTEGTYNALWIKGSGSYAVNVAANSLDVYAGTDGSTVLAAAITAANGARTKLVMDTTLSTAITSTVSVNLDMNGCKILAGTNSILTLTDTTGNVVESSRANGGFKSNNSTARKKFVNGGQFDLIRDITINGNKGSEAIYLDSATEIKNCIFEGYIAFNKYYEVPVGGVKTLIDNCTITSTGSLIMGVQNGAEVTVTNTTMSTTSTNTNALIQGNSDADGFYGVIKLGAGNEITATTAACLVGNCNTVEFTSLDSTYRIKAGGQAVQSEKVTNVIVLNDLGYSVDGEGYVRFGETFTITYINDIGSIETTKTAVKGYGVDLTYTYTIGNGKEYKIIGWTDQQGGTEPLTELIATGDTTLYAIKARKGVIIGTVNTEYTSGTAKYNTSSTSAFVIYNADKLGELDSLQLTWNSSKVYYNFSAEALDYIASQITGEGKDISVSLNYKTSGLTLNNAVRQIKLEMTYDGQPIVLNGGVEAQVQRGTTNADNIKFAAYDVANTNNELAVAVKNPSANFYYCFQLPGNGTYEVVQLPGSYLTEDQMTGNPSVSLKDDEGLSIETAAKLADMDSLTIDDANSNKIKFSAAALDDIAAKAGTSGVTIHSVTGTPSEQGIARVDLSVLDGNGAPVDFSGAVEVKIRFTPQEGKNYRAYYLPENGEPVALATKLEEIYYNMYAVFTTTHFSTFEVRETTVANGYTAALDVTESEVRAGGNAVNVKVNVTHSDETVYNAGEIKLSYDSNLLTFDETNSTLPDNNATCKAENGVLTVEFYGKEISMPHSMNLVFTTCDSVNADTTTTVTLTNAAFADNVDAQTENLIEATIDPASDAVTIKLEELPVEKDNEIVQGNETVVKGTDYTFNVQQPDDYNYDSLKVTVDGVDITDKLIKGENGQYTIPADYVTGAIVIEDNRTPNVYDVTINFTGDDADQPTTDSATYGVDFQFTIPTPDGYQYTLKEVVINGVVYNGYTCEGNVVTIPGAYIKGDIVITIEKDDTLFTVTVEGNGAGDASIADQHGEQSYDKGDSVILTITPAAGYKNYRVTATMANVDVTSALTVNGNTYTLANIDGDIVFTVTKEVAGSIEITPYLTLNADETGENSQGMFLVRYTDASASGNYVPLCNTKAMYWSSVYNAYCYLVIDTDLASAEEHVSITASTSGTNEEIAYTMNVNGSSDINGDAADAQLVYDMYTTMYKEFTEDVTMMKFLLADTNGDMKITTEDAQKIINTLLGLN